jgi:hypothetical protein
MAGSRNNLAVEAALAHHRNGGWHPEAAQNTVTGATQERFTAGRFQGNAGIVDAPTRP